jgi:CheY-like chemotaxis protein
LQQVLWNLLSNAVKFNRRGGWARVCLRRVASHVEISVVDSGEGIAPEFLPHVFDRFRQADSSTTRKYGGLGLGLSIVRHLVELHGGVVHAESPGQGRGAAFTVSLPLLAVVKSGELPPADVPHPAPYAHMDCAVDLSGLSVLAVDDEPDSSRMVKRVLEECGAAVETANSAREALELLQQQRFHVLVSDIGMPVEDGYDLMRTVRSLDGTAREVRSVALTAFARSEDKHRANLAGFQAHVAKPVEAAELIAVVGKLAGRTPTPAGRRPAESPQSPGA